MIVKSENLLLFEHDALKYGMYWREGRDCYGE